MPKELFPIVLPPAVFKEAGPEFNPALITKKVHKDVSLHINIFDRIKLSELTYWPTIKVKSYVTSFMDTERHVRY